MAMGAPASRRLRRLGLQLRPRHSATAGAKDRVCVVTGARDTPPRTQPHMHAAEAARVRSSASARAVAVRSNPRSG